MLISYTLIRSRRKSLSIQIDTDGNLIARAPIHMLISSIDSFILKKKDWIEKHQKKIKSLPKKIIPNTGEIKEYKKTLKEYIIPRIEKLSHGKNLPPITSIKITLSERRWGSCSSKNGLCFSYRLAQYIDTPFLDAIIIHELAHLIEKNHQKSFWDLVTLWMPEYESIMKNRG